MELKQSFLVYKSSAGSGKTFNLAKVFLTLLLLSPDPLYFRRILAITFTVKAAAEMKDRIITYLSILSGNKTYSRSDAGFMLDALKAETGLSEAEIRHKCSERLTHLLHHYGDFSIMTIDKFFARLVRAFASDLSLNPDFQIQIDEKLFIERVTDLLFEEVGNDEKLTGMLVHMLKSRLAEDLSNNADEVIAKACRTLLSDDFFTIKEGFRHFSPDEIYALKSKLDIEINTISTGIVALAREALDLMDQWSVEAGDLYGGKNGIHSFYRKAAMGDFEKVLEPSATMLKVVENDQWQSSTKNENVLSIKDKLHSLFHDIIAKRPLLERMNLLLAIRKEVYTLGFHSELLRLFDLVKEEDNMRLLSDFNKMIAEQLKHEHTAFLFERLGTQYSHLLIDEFQDTSLLQWNNLIPLIENSLSEGHVSMLVGDAKQSIYRFRNSEPDQFIALPAVAHPSSYLLEASYNEQSLDQNFRSATNVVDFNNRLFHEIAKRSGSARLQATYKQVQQQTASKTTGSVHWWFADEDTNHKDQVLEKMLGRIDELISGEGVKPGEICCLFRTNSDAASAAAQLLESGFDVVSQESLLLANNPGVQLIVATWSSLAAPSDDFLVQQWLSRYHQIHPLKNHHELAIQVKQKHWSLFKLAQVLNINFQHPDLQHGESFSKSLAITHALHLDPGNGFVSKFLDLCLQFENNAHYLKSTFLEYWEEKSVNASIALAGVNNAITVMTIHKAKGLEFPTVLVFLPEPGKSKNTKSHDWVDLKGEFELKNMSLALSDLKQTAFREFYDTETEKSYLDNINVMYVAFTRAENRLEIFSKRLPKGHDLEFLQEWDEYDARKSVLYMG